MHANLIAVLSSLLLLFAAVACFLVRGGAINEREELKQIEEAERNIQWPVSH
jgi:hypothetical protein